MKKSLVSTLSACAAAAVFGGQPANAAPTYTRDVAPILNESCVNCHRPGAIAPMSLMTFKEVRPWAKAIEKNVSEGVMPPWHADPGFGPFTNDRSLDQEKIDTILEWVKVGTPQGDPSDLPEALDFGDGEWSLGEPDLIIEFDAVDVPASGPDMFKDLVAKTNLDEDKWIKAVEIKAGSSKVVHHVILWQSEGERAGQNTDGWISAWAAGAVPDQFREGTGRLLKKGANIIGDMHYHPADTDETDQTRVGLYFADDGEIEKELVNLWVMDLSFEIPPGDPNYEARSTYKFMQDSHILGLAPHMHYRGKDFSYTATFPDGTTKELLSVSKFDFNWQTNYLLEEPIAVPKGTRIDCVAHWDNSADNPANPDPTKTVRFGPESYDEMMIGFIDYIVDEGIRPMETSSPIHGRIAELVELDPGNVYTIENPSGPTGEPQLNAIHLPREGEGGWYITFNSIIGKARLFDIAWDGESFNCKMSIPGQGVNDLSGTRDSESRTLALTMTGADGNANEMTANFAD